MVAGFSTNYTVNRPQLSACAADLNSTTKCAHVGAKISSQNQVARNAAMRGGGEAPPRITISQAPAASSGTISASPVNANTNMVTTTKASVGGQAQTQYDSAVDKSGAMPESSSPRAKIVQEGGNKVSVGGDKVSVGGAFGKWINRLNKSGGGKKKRTTKKRRKKRGHRKGRRRTGKKRGRIKGRRRTQKHRKKRKKSPKKKSFHLQSPAFRKRYFRKRILALIEKYKK